MKAFPINSTDGENFYTNTGMDLRDYFASHFISNSGIPFNKEKFLDHAKDAYKWADAMMEARNVTK